MIKAYLRYLLVNGLFDTLLVGALFIEPFNHNQNLARLMAFFVIVITIIAWIQLPLSVLVALVAKPNDKKKLPKKISHVPVWFDVLHDIIVTGCFIYAGWVWMGALYFSHIFPIVLSKSLLEYAAAKQNEPEKV